MTKPTAIEYFNAGAASYTQSDARYSMFNAQQYLQELATLEVFIGKLLDVGIGSGSLSFPFASNGFDIHGVDGAQKMIEECQKNAANINLLLEGKTKQADLETAPIPFEDGMFSLTITNASLLYMKNACDVIREMIRVTEPGGVIVIDPYVHLDDEASVITPPSRPNKPQIYIQSDRSIQDIFVEFNLKVLAEKTTGRIETVTDPELGSFETEVVTYYLRKPSV